MDLAQPTLTPKKDHFKLYKMNRVNKTNWIYIYIYIYIYPIRLIYIRNVIYIYIYIYYISSLATLKETFTAKYYGVLHRTSSVRPKFVIYYPFLW